MPKINALVGGVFGFTVRRLVPLGPNPGVTEPPKPFVSGSKPPARTYSLKNAWKGFCACK